MCVKKSAKPPNFNIASLGTKNDRRAPHRREQSPVTAVPAPVVGSQQHPQQRRPSGGGGGATEAAVWVDAAKLDGAQEPPHRRLDLGSAADHRTRTLDAAARAANIIAITITICVVAHARCRALAHAGQEG